MNGSFLFLSSFFLLTEMLMKSSIQFELKLFLWDSIWTRRLKLFDLLKNCKSLLANLSKIKTNRNCYSFFTRTNVELFVIFSRKKNWMKRFVLCCLGMWLFFCCCLICFFYCKDLSDYFQSLWLKLANWRMFGEHTLHCIVKLWVDIDLKQNKPKNSKEWATIATKQIQIFGNQIWSYYFRLKMLTGLKWQRGLDLCFK